MRQYPEETPYYPTPQGTAPYQGNLFYLIAKGAPKMPFTISVAGQVGQIKLAQAKALWPLFETVINSIQSLEDTKEAEKEIIVEAIRDPQVQIHINSDGTKTEEPSHFTEFVVSDNGNGFNSENYSSFLEAYSQLKVKKGCKGIGRFLWLKAFDEVIISSDFRENGRWFHRSFSFSLAGVSPEDNLIELDGSSHKRQTKVTLKHFKPTYRDSVAYKLESLARKIIEHCLPYFIMGICPKIILKDNRGKSILLNEYYNNTYKDSLHQDQMALKEQHYTLYHMLLTEGAEKHELHLCANNREVKSYDLAKKIPNLQKRIETNDNNGYYVGYLTGNYLDEAINTERSEFVFSDLPIMGENRGASEEEIVDTAVGFIREYLLEDLKKIGDEKKDQIDRLVQSTRPQYRFLLNQRPEVYDIIPSGLSDEKLDIELFKHQQEWELDTARQGQDIDDRIKKDATEDITFEKLFKEYCQSITGLSRAGLAEYVARRKAVIELLGKALEADDSGQYSKESRIHSIICPMQVSSDDIPYNSMNLWLIDDRLAYHYYLASDKKMNSIPTLESNVDKRMDIAIFDAALSYTTDPQNINSITIVELKRPMRQDNENDPVAQVLRYVRDIKEGKVKKRNGRDFGDMRHVSFYCYVIGDLTPSMCDSAENAGLTKTQDGQGYFGYNPTRGAYIEVISYDKLLKDARQRNQVFFDKLFNPKASDLTFPEMY